MNVIVPWAQWIYAQLTSEGAPGAYYSEATGWRVYEAQASRSRPSSGVLPTYPESPTYPLIRIGIQAANPTNANGGRRLVTVVRAMFEAITDTEDLFAVQSGADWIDSLFAQRATGTQSGLYIGGSWTVNMSTRTENDALDLQVYKRLGGTYEFFCYETGG